MHSRTGHKNRLTFWTLILIGIFLWLTGLPLAAYDYAQTYPYLITGFLLIALGMVMVVVSAIQRINLHKAQIIIGLSGQVLFGLVIFAIPLLPSFPFSPFNFHTYSIVLGVLGIVLSLESIIMLSKYRETPLQQ
jgi:hypothetical protein